jgi:hypothetical protein
MATKKIDIQFDIDNKAVKIAGEETMKLTQQVRLLKAELASGKYSQEEFEILATKLGDVEDQMAKTRTRAGDLFTSLQLIPGPVGEIASKINGAIALLKQFSGFSFKDFQFQLKESINDIKDIGRALLQNTGLAEAFGRSVQATRTGFDAVGQGINTATASVGRFRAALISTGIGALVVAVGLIVAYWEDIVALVNGVSLEQKRLNDSIRKDLEAQQYKLTTINNQTNQLKLQGKTEKEILDLKIAESAEAIRLGQINVANAKFTRDSQIAAAKRNTEILETAIKVVTAPINLLLTQIDKIGDLLGKNFDLVNQFSTSVSNLVFDPEKIKEDGDLAVQEAEKTLNQLKEDQAGFILSIREIDKKAVEDKKQSQKQEQEDFAKAQAIQREAELSLLTAQEREIRERTDRFNADLAELKRAGYTDFKALEEEYRIDLEAIDFKYTEEKKAKEKKEQEEQQIRDKQLRDARLAELDAANQAEINRIEEKYGEFRRFDQAYYQDLRDEYTRNEQALKEANARKDITDAEYQKRITASSKARRELDVLERDSAIQKTQLIGDAFGQLSSIVGQETVAGKAFAVAKATIDTYTSAVSAYNALVGIPVIGPALAAIAAGAAVASGIATVKKIVAVQVPNTSGGGTGNLTQTTPSAPAERPSAINVAASPIKAAVGGLIRGPGTETSDSIPAMLSDGEFVVNARSTRLFQPILSAINASADLPGFAMGGLVDKNRDRPAKDNSDTIAEAINVAFRDQPIRTYVTAGEISNEQQFDRIIKSRSLI